MYAKNISSSLSENITDVQINKRTVFYEELAESYYLFTRKDAFENSTIPKEINYHIGNILLLTFYFDVVFVQTASIFNSSNPFVREVVKGVLSNKKLREMLNHNVVKIVGWGGSSPNDMFQSAKEFSISANPKGNDDDYFSIVASIFNPENIVTRSLITPDEGIENLFKKRLEQTTIIKDHKEYLKVNAAIERSLEKTGQFIAVAFSPELGKLKLNTSSLSAVEVSFLQSWYDHLKVELPGIVTYAPMTKSIFIDQTMQINKEEVRTFLYSPQIFSAFLSGYLSNADFNKILKYSYSELHKVKNGDWKRFCDAYHEAVATISNNISHLCYAEISDEAFNNNNLWSAELSQILDSEKNNMDINAFIESLAMLSGVILSVPFLGPMMKTVGNLTGKKTNELFQSIKANATLEISPFIQKLIKNYELEGVRA